MKYDITGMFAGEFTLLDVEAANEEEAKKTAIERVKRGENHLLSNALHDVVVESVEIADSEK